MLLYSLSRRQLRRIARFECPTSANLRKRLAHWIRRTLRSNRIAKPFASEIARSSAGRNLGPKLRAKQAASALSPNLPKSWLTVG
jgi:hypothetical protein